MYDLRPMQSLRYDPVDSVRRTQVSAKTENDGLTGIGSMNREIRR